MTRSKTDMCCPNSTYPEANRDLNTLLNAGTPLQKATLVNAWAHAKIAVTQGTVRKLEERRETANGALHTALSVSYKLFNFLPPVAAKVVIGEHGGRPCFDILACGVKERTWLAGLDAEKNAAARFEEVVPR